MTLTVIPSATAALTPASFQLSQGVATATFSATSATSYFITASSPGLQTGSTTVVVVPAAPAGLEIASGNNQTAAVGHVLQRPLRVRVRDVFTNPAPGVAVTFTVTAGGGAVSAGVAPAASVQTVTDNFGFAEAGATVGNQSAAQQFAAAVSGVSPVTFTASKLGSGGALAVVANLGSDTVSIISTAAFVASDGADAVAVVDLSTNILVTTVPVGKFPTGIAVTRLPQ